MAANHHVLPDFSDDLHHSAYHVRQQSLNSRNIETTHGVLHLGVRASEDAVDDSIAFVPDDALHLLVHLPLLHSELALGVSRFLLLTTSGLSESSS